MKMSDNPYYFVRIWHGLKIYGYTIGSEFEEDQKKIKQEATRGQLFTECFSEACTEGEIGFTPERQTREITREQFEEARARGWK